MPVMLCTCDPAPPTGTEAARFTERRATGVDSENRLTPTESLNIVEYLYYYNGGGVAATDINGDSLPDLFFTNNQGDDRYFINEGDWQFRDATEAAGVAGTGNWSTGVSVEDVNGDGLPDIYVCRVGGYGILTGRNQLFVQLPDGTFTDRAAEYGLDFTGFNTQAYWFDYDRDGDLDVYLLRHSAHNDATYGEATAREVPDSLAGDKLLRNDGGTFTEVTAEMGIYSSQIGYGLSVAIADFDGNGYPDLYVCNDFSENDYLYLNEEGNGFRETVRERMGHTSNFSMGSDVGDLDGDGWADIVSLDMRPGDETILKATASADAYNIYGIKRRAGYYDQLPRNNVQWNRGGGHFSEIGELSGLAATDWSWSVIVEDFDQDGHEEVFVANGIERRPNDLDYLKFISSSLAREASNLAVVEQMPEGKVANQLFVREAELRYRRADWGLGYVGSTTGAAVADFDGDGDMDLVLNNVNAPARLYENHHRESITEQPPPRPRKERYGYQRGFLSQSERPAVTLPPYAPESESTGFDFVVDTLSGSAPVNSFDREPLQPYANADFGDTVLQVQLTDGTRLTGGAWQALRIGRREGGRYVYSELPASRGLWQSLSVIDDPSGAYFIAGNWGENSALGRPVPDAPLRLYLEDLDGNGRRDPLITYVRGGREYTLADKDELARQFPSWRKNNLSYTDFARRSFGENFSELSVEPLVVETLAHHRVYRDTTGAWKLERLPTSTQVTPLNTAAYTPDGVLLGGNRLDVLPRIGRQDAAALQLLTAEGEIRWLDLGGARNRAEIGEIELLKSGTVRLGVR